MASDILTSIGTNQDAVDTLVRSLIDIRSPLSPTNPQIQGAFTTDVVSSAVGPQPIDPKKRSMVKSSTPNGIQKLDPLLARLVTAATSDSTDNADKNKSSNSLQTQQLLSGKIIHIHM